MPEEWFLTSDTHFSHKNILLHEPTRSERLAVASTVEEMNEVMIKRWNERVPARGGHVIHCGDLAFGSVEAAKKIIRRLNGSIHFIEGNHDSVAKKIKGMFADYHQIHEFKVQDRIIVACHYAIRSWSKIHYGAVHAYGHSHGSLSVDMHSPSMDVGVDTNNLYPYSADEFFAIVDQRKFVPVDHHA